MWFFLSKTVWTALVWLLIAVSPAIKAQAESPETSRLALGLNGISDWSTQHPFLDLMKSARPWIGHLPGQWGGVDTDALWDGGFLDDRGWPTAIPPGVSHLETLILTDQPDTAEWLRGTYILLFEGTGRVDITGRGRLRERRDGRLVFSYAPGPGAVGIAIRETDPADPVRNIRVLRTDQLALFEAGEVFNPDWLARILPVASMRFMDWMMTNGSTQTRWMDRPRITDFSYAWRGVPLPVMIALANRTGADPWFTMPHRANDDYVRAFAQMVAQDLNAGLVAHVEYSNEVWNFLFPQAAWAQDRAAHLWGDREDGWMQFYGLRAAQTMAIWTEAFGASAPERLARIVSVHTGWPGLEAAILDGPLAERQFGAPLVTAFDAYAVTGYFGHELGSWDALEPLVEASRAKAREAGKAQGLRRVALREYEKAHGFERAFAQAAEMVRESSLQELRDKHWPHHASVAREHGLALIMYEGGSHAAPHFSEVDNEDLVNFLTAFNYSEEMGALYAETLTAWAAQGGKRFNAFVDVAPASQWGSWGALRHLGDDNPRWRALQAYNLPASSAKGAEDAGDQP